MELNAKRVYAKPSEQDNQPGLLNRDGAPGEGPLRWLTTLLVLVFPTATLFLNRGDSYVLGLLSLIGVWVWLRYSARPWLNRHSAALWLAFVLFFAVAVLSYVVGLQTEDGFHFLGRYLRFLFIVPVFLAFRRYPPTAKTVFIGLAVGALISGLLASLQFLHTDRPIRVEGTTDLSIIFGDLTTTMVLCTVAGFGLMAESRRKRSALLLILCLAGGVAATLLSGTRGAWLPLLLLIPVLATSTTNFLRRRHVFAILVIMIAIFSSFYLITRTDGQERLKDSIENAGDYLIALHYFNIENGKAELPRYCNNHIALLKAWANFDVTNRSRQLVASVVSDPNLFHYGICQDKYAVELQNHSASEAIWYYFPRLALIDSKKQTSTLLARGSGSMALDGEKLTQVNFSFQHYQLIEIKSTDVPGTSVYVRVPPRGIIHLVPIDGYPGEYSLSIADTSIGKRFEMWRSAWHLWLGHPILGVGTGAFGQMNDQLIKQRLIAPFVKDYDHPHNDYLNALVSTGIIGFAVLITILLIPLRRFWRATSSTGRAAHAVGMAGVLTIAGFAIYALTDTVFLHSMMITWYVIYMALFYALLDVQESRLAKPEAPK